MTGGRTSRALLALVAVAAFVAAADPVPAVPPATAAIERLNATLLDVMKNAEKLGFEGRRAQLEPVLDATYDFPAMAQRSLGPAFAKLDEAQRARFVQAFRGMTLRTYATRFTGWAGERFETKGQEDSVAGTVIVRSVVHAENEDVSLDYRLRDTPSGWRVIDVYLRGTVSELALRRSEYSAVLEREGFEALLSALERKVAEAESVPAGAAPPSSDSRDK
jgi:phospholipid transport system substrate-binding protein